MSRSWRLLLFVVWSVCLWSSAAPAAAAPRQADQSIEEQIAKAREEILSLEKDIAEKQAKWDKLYADYIRIMNNSGGRPGPNLRMKVNSLDADARKIKAEIDAQKKVLEATELHLLSLEEEFEHQQRAKREAETPREPAQRQAPAPPGEQRVEPPVQRPSEAPRLPETPQFRQGRTRASSPPPEPPKPTAHPSARLPMLDLLDPVGSGGASEAVYRWQTLTEKFGEETVVGTTEVVVRFDASGMPYEVERIFDTGHTDAGFKVKEQGTDRLDFSDGRNAWVIRIASRTPTTDGSTEWRFRTFDDSGDEISQIALQLESIGNGPRIRSASIEGARAWLNTPTVAHAWLMVVRDRAGSYDGMTTGLTSVAGSMQFRYYPSGRIGSIGVTNNSESELDLDYTYLSEGLLGAVDVHGGGRDEAQTARLVCTAWDESGRWTSLDVYSKVDDFRSRETRKWLLKRTARVLRAFDRPVDPAKFIHREFNEFPPRAGRIANTPAEDPELLDLPSVAATGGVGAGTASASGIQTDPRLIEVPGPVGGSNMTALEREGLSALLIGFCTVALVIALGVIWLLIAGFSDSIIIFDDWLDFGLSFLSAFAVLAGIGGAAVALGPDGSWTGFAAAVVVVIAGIAAGIRSFSLAFRNNGRGFLGVVVGIFKIFAGLLIVVGIFGHGSTLLDKKSRTHEQLRAAIVLAIFAAVAYALVNGKRVREKRAAAAAGGTAAAAGVP